MPTFRSNSSAYTTMTVNISEVARGDGWALMRCNWSVTTGSATSLGASSSNWRNLRIYRSDGVLLAEQQIKSSSQTWTNSSTYSGSFDFYIGVPHNAGSISIYIRTNADGTQSCIWTDPDYCTNFNLAWSLFYTSIGAPTNPACSPNAFENSLTFSWGAAGDGVNNIVQTYHLYYRVNYGAEIGVDVGKVTSWVLDTSGLARGDVIDFHIASLPQYGSAQWSGWSVPVAKNRAPNQPTSPSVPRTSYIPGETIVVSFANTGDHDGNLAGFEVATDQDETIVGTNASPLASSVNVDTTGWPQGAQRRFRVRGYDAHGVRGAWSNYTATVTLNTTPTAPLIMYPLEMSTVYSCRPHILLRAGETNDGPKHILCVNDGTEKTTAANGALFSCGTNDNLTSLRPVVYVSPGEYLIGGAGISARMYDSFLHSSAVSRVFTVAALAVTDPDISTAGMKIKAVHITDLQTAINALRAAYGLAAATFTTVTAGVTSIGNAAIITELQTALQAVIDRINGWDSATTTFDLSVTWVNPAAAGGGVDRVKLRQAIEQIRSVIPTI